MIDKGYRNETLENVNTNCSLQLLVRVGSYLEARSSQVLGSPVRPYI